MNSKKGQLKIQQMTMMLLAVTLFFVLAGMFILVTEISGLKQAAATIQNNNAELLVSKIADSPEFSCGESYGTGASGCIDADKVLNLENIISKYDNGNFWGVSGLEIRIVYPQNNATECTLSNFPNCSQITIIPSSNGTGVSNFVSLCGYYQQGGQAYTQCNLAEIIATYQGA